MARKQSTPMPTTVEEIRLAMAANLLKAAEVYRKAASEGLVNADKVSQALLRDADRNARLAVRARKRAA